MFFRTLRFQMSTSSMGFRQASKNVQEMVHVLPDSTAPTIILGKNPFYSPLEISTHKAHYDDIVPMRIYPYIGVSV